MVRTVKIVDTLRPVIGLRYGSKLLHVSDASDTAVIHRNGVETRVSNPVQASFFDTRRLLSSSRGLQVAAQHSSAVAAGLWVLAVAAAAVVIYRRPSASAILNPVEV